MGEGVVDILHFLFPCTALVCLSSSTRRKRKCDAAHITTQKILIDTVCSGLRGFNIGFINDVVWRSDLPDNARNTMPHVMIVQYHCTYASTWHLYGNIALFSLFQDVPSVSALAYVTVKQSVWPLHCLSAVGFRYCKIVSHARHGTAWDPLSRLTEHTNPPTRSVEFFYGKSSPNAASCNSDSMGMSLLQRIV